MPQNAQLDGKTIRVDSIAVASLGCISILSWIQQPPQLLPFSPPSLHHHPKNRRTAKRIVFQAGRSGRGFDTRYAATIALYGFSGRTASSTKLRQRSAY